MVRRALLRSALAIATGLACFSQALAAQSTSPLLSPAQATADFDVLHRALAEAHGGYTRFASRAEIESRLSTHRARLDRPMAPLEFAGIVAEAIAELRDGHARLEFDSTTTAQFATAPMLPLRLSLEGERLIVRFNDSPSDRTFAPSAEILSINGRRAGELVNTLLPKVSGDGFIETGRRYRLAQEFARLYWLYVEQPAQFTVVTRGAAGTQVTATLPAVSARDRNAAANPVNAAVLENSARLDGPPGRVALEFLDDGRVARLRVRAFDGQSFLATLDSAFREVRARGTASLILDLRGNGGGVDEYGAKLVSYFTERPFRYFDRIHITTIAPSFATWLPRTFDAVKAGSVPDPAGGFLITPEYHTGVGEQQPSNPGFAGRVVVLIDGGSFSTTADVAAQLRAWGRAVFVGEETAGTYEGNTSGLNALIVLPSSKLRLRVMMYGYWNAVRPVPGGRGVVPEHVVPVRVADLVAGRDPALARALDLLK